MPENQCIITGFKPFRMTRISGKLDDWLLFSDVPHKVYQKTLYCNLPVNLLHLLQGRDTLYAPK